MPLYTQVCSLWLNIAESVQRIIVQHALAGQHPKDAERVIDWLEQTAQGATRTTMLSRGTASGKGDAHADVA